MQEALPEIIHVRDMTDVHDLGQGFLHRILWRPPPPCTNPPDLLRSVLAREEADLHCKEKEGRNAIDVVLHRIEYEPHQSGTQFQQMCPRFPSRCAGRQ